MSARTNANIKAGANARMGAGVQPDACTVVITGGGTGGHVMPALALAEQFSALGARVLFAGARRGLENRLVPEAGYPLRTFPVHPLVGRSLARRALALLALLAALPRALWFLLHARAQLVVCVGGYAAAPATLAAFCARIPIALLNCDASAGLANRLLARCATRIYVGFEGAASAFDARRVRVSGVPLRAAFCKALAEYETAPGADAATAQAPGANAAPGARTPREEVANAPSRSNADAAHETTASTVNADAAHAPEADAAPGSAASTPHKSAASARRLHLFAFGGSLGARQLNDALLAVADELDPRALEVVHQTGAADCARVAVAWSARGFDATVLAFERDMARRYHWADLVVCRAGAVSVAELAHAGRAALLVPLAHTGGGEQPGNARELERAGAARVLDGAHLQPRAFGDALRALLKDRAQLQAMGRAARRLTRPDAAANIARDCLQLAERKP